MSTPKALHSAATPKWGTPPEIIELARLLMGYIHLDPASSEEFNYYVRALMIYTELSNGLAPESEWSGNVFLNPPGGLVKEFWDRLVKEYESGNIQKAVWIGFSVEQLCTLADKERHPMDYSICVLRKRLSFTREDLTTGGSPSHGNYICALGCDPKEFERLFGHLGKITHGGRSLLTSEEVNDMLLTPGE
jgi:hypothetical protein